MAHAMDKLIAALNKATIRRAPPWPPSARKYMQDNRCQLLGWYDDPDPESRARIFLAKQLEGPDELAAVLSEEICHHVYNSLTDGAINVQVQTLLRKPAWREALFRRLIVWLWKRA